MGERLKPAVLKTCLPLPSYLISTGSPKDNRLQLGMFGHLRGCEYATECATDILSLPVQSARKYSGSVFALPSPCGVR